MWSSGCMEEQFLIRILPSILNLEFSNSALNRLAEHQNWTPENWLQTDEVENLPGQESQNWEDARKKWCTERGWTDDRRRQTRVRTRTASCRALASGGRGREPPSGGGQQGEQSTMNWWVQLFFLSSALLQFTASYQCSLCILPLWSKKLGRILKCYFLERSHLDWLRNLIEVVMSLFCLLFTLINKIQQ